MTMALTDPTLEKPSRSLAPKNLHFTTMTEYDASFRVPFVLPREHPNNILADVMAVSYTHLPAAHALARAPTLLEICDPEQPARSESPPASSPRN